MNYVAIDIGGSKTDIGLYSSKDQEEPDLLANFETDKSYTQGLANIKHALTQLLGTKKPKAVAVSCAGVILDGELKLSPNLPDWSGHKIKTDLEHMIGQEINIANDAVCAGLAEYAHHKEKKTFMNIVWGTGIGGVFIDPREGLHIFPTEPTQMVINKENYSKETDRGKARYYLGGGMLAEHSGKDLATLEDTDPLWNQAAGDMAILIHNLRVTLMPEIIYFSGSVVTNRPFLLKQIENQLKQNFNFPFMPEIKLSQVQGNASLKGALKLLK